jgi:hypothetical protein
LGIEDMGMGMGMDIFGYGYRYGYLGLKKPGIPKMAMDMGIPEPGITVGDSSIIKVVLLE